MIEGKVMPVIDMEVFLSKYFDKKTSREVIEKLELTKVQKAIVTVIQDL